MKKKSNNRKFLKQHRKMVILATIVITGFIIVLSANFLYKNYNCKSECIGDSEWCTSVNEFKQYSCDKKIFGCNEKIFLDKCKLPDIRILHLSISTLSPYVEEEFILNGIVEIGGPKITEPIEVSFYAVQPDSNKTELIGETFIFDNRTQPVVTYCYSERKSDNYYGYCDNDVFVTDNISYTTKDAGNYDFYFVVDPQNKITEFNEENNRYEGIFARWREYIHFEHLQ